MSHEPKMTCRLFRKLLTAEYLSDSEIEELGEHVERCPSCEAFVSTISKEDKKLEEELRQIQPKDPGPVPHTSRRKAARMKEHVRQEARRRFKAFRDVGRKEREEENV